VAAVVSWWVATYTRHLPTEVGERRRAEVASDLWEQRADGREAATGEFLVALSILRRMAAGMPADLRWRRGQLAAARGRMPAPAERRLLHALGRNLWLVLAGLVGVTEVVVGARIALRGGDPVTGTGITASVGPTIGGGLLIAGAGLLLLSGIVVRRRSPGRRRDPDRGRVASRPADLAVDDATRRDPRGWPRPLPGSAGSPRRHAHTLRLPGGAGGRQPGRNRGGLYLVLVRRVPWWAGLVLLGLVVAYHHVLRRDHATSSACASTT
jgi:hypothetical protein